MTEGIDVTWKEAAILALEGNDPMTAAQIVAAIKEKGLRTVSGKTPDATVSAHLYTAIKAGDPRIRQAGTGLFQHTGVGAPQKTRKAGRTKQAQQRNAMSFLDAAERVLDLDANRKPMAVAEIVQLALDKGLIDTQGLTPAATLSAQIGTDTRRRVARGEAPRFTNPRRGFYGLSVWEGEGIARAVNQHRRETALGLKKRLRALTPDEFEIIVGQIMVAIGVEDAQVVGKSGDKGIDVRGTLVVSDVIRRKIVAQAKRWTSSSVGSPEVRNLRGSLGPHDLALLVTVGTFSEDAREEAERSDATPVALLDGDGIVNLMLEHQIGVTATTLELFEMTDLELGHGLGDGRE